MNIPPLKTDADHAKAVAEIEKLMDATPGSEAFDRLATLAELVDDYEGRAHPIEAPDPVDAILFHLEQLGDPFVETADYIDVSTRLEELRCPKLDDYAIGILPEGFDTLTGTERIAISEPTRTLVRLFKENDVPFSIAKREGQSLGKRKTASLGTETWIGPTLFASAALVYENPQVISLVLRVIADHLASFPPKSSASFGIVLEHRKRKKKRSSKTFTKITCKLKL